MINTIVATHDINAKLYGNPIIVPQAGVAIREFGEECRKPESVYNKFSEDFEMVELGIYDNQTGKIKIHKEPVVIARAKDYAKKTK